MITVGRAPNNDVCLPLSSVSKLHAYFQEQGKKWFVKDQSSSNGTFLNGQKLSKEKPAEIQDGAHVAFGPDTDCLFKLPSGLYGFLQYLDPPIWDRYWMAYTTIASIGQPEPYMVRVFSTLNAPAG